MASWDAATSAGAKRVGLRCLACGRRLEESLAVLGSLRCLDCRESNAAPKSQLTSEQEALRAAKVGFFRPSPTF
jgi:hypothetical protein